MFEVLVIENNQASSKILYDPPKPLAIWTVLAETLEDANAYLNIVNEQNEKFNTGQFTGQLTWSVMIIDYTRIPNSDLALTLEPLSIQEYYA